MPQGLEVYNPDGTLRTSITDYLGRVVGQIQVSGTGSVQFPAISGNNSKHAACVSKGTSSDNVITTAYAYMSGNTVYYSQGDDAQPIILLFLVY